MKWDKKGFVFGPDGSLTWAKNSALTPTPFLIDEETIRVYSGFRDGKGISRIGYVDLDASNPSRVKHISKNPVLDVGKPGAFDDNGIILGDIIRVGNQIRMYYIGFQLVNNVKFLAFTGLAVSSDGGISFNRYSDTPIMDRSSNGMYIRAVHSVMHEDNKFRVWFASGNGWEFINGKPYPQYDIRYIESPNGINFIGEGTLCVETQGDEYRIGRPRVFEHNGNYIMHYTRGMKKGDYLAGAAISLDGLSWNRDDSALGIALSNDGWDSRHLCYPAIIKVRDNIYMFYNGNDMGYDGFGYATLNKE